MLYVIAIIKTVPGTRAEVLRHIEENRPAVLAESGCIEYRAAVDAADPAPVWASYGPEVIVIVEKWESRAALKAHAAAPHMAAYAAKVKDLVAGREIHVLDPLG